MTNCKSGFLVFLGLAFLVSLFLIFTPTNDVNAHPGNTASDGCHYCRTNCSSWGVAWNARHCHGGSSYTPTYPSTPSYPTTPSCPLNSYYDSLYSNCKCNSGYKVSKDGNSCISNLSYCWENYGYSSTYDYLSGGCECSSGYVFDEDFLGGLECVSCSSKYGYGAKWSYLEDSCVCKDGYHVESDTFGDGQSCVRDSSTYSSPSVCYDTVNGYLSSDGNCYCNAGYSWSGSLYRCVVSGGSVSQPSSTPSGPGIYSQSDCESNYGDAWWKGSTSTCECQSGYAWNNDTPSKCIPVYDWCKENVGSHSTAKSSGSYSVDRSVKEVCVCTGAYEFNDSGTYCVPSPIQISEPLVITPTPTSSPTTPGNIDTKRPNSFSSLRVTSRISTIDITPTSSIGADKNLVTETSPNCTPNTLIKGSLSAVYYCGADGKRYVFPNKSTYDTWYLDFDGVTQISDSELAKIRIGGNVTFRPGIRMVKIVSSPVVYAVAKNGVLRPIASEEVAVELYGTNWNQLVSDIPDAFFTNYTLGSEINF